MRSRVGKRTRALFVFLHVAVSVGWMGAGAANVVLAMTALHTSTVELRRVCYFLIERIDAYLVIPLAFAALTSGVLLSLVTPWGLTRYWWVLGKLVVTVGVIVYSTFGLGVWVEQSIEATLDGRPSEVAGLLAYGAAVNIALFLLMTWASVAKPWGTTPWTAGAPRRVGPSVRRSSPSPGRG